MDDERQRGARRRAFAAFTVAGLLLVGNVVAMAAMHDDGDWGHGPGGDPRRDLPFTPRDDGRDQPVRPDRNTPNPAPPGED